jgi:hypothetical protein
MADTPLTPPQVEAAEQRAVGETYPHKVLVALDQDVNVDTGGLPDETISSRVRRISDAHPCWCWNPGVWLAKAMNAGLNLIEKNHGAKAQSGDLQRAETVVATEEKALGIGEQK